MFRYLQVVITYFLISVIPTPTSSEAEITKFQRFRA